MKIHEPLDHPRYARHLWWVMLAGCAARFTAEPSVPQAATGFLFWALAFGACSMVRSAVSRGPDTARRRERAGNIIAAAGMLLFVVKLSAEGLLPALLAFLFAIQAATFVIASKRLHAYLLLAAAFAGLMFAAAESRSGAFLVCAVWFTFAMLGLLTFDQRRERERQALLQPESEPGEPNHSLLYGALVLALTLPVYLFVPKPAGLLLGGMQARTAHDYREHSAPPDSRQTGSTQASASQESGDEPIRPRADEQVPSHADPARGFYDDSFSTTDVRREGGLANGIVMFVKSSHPVNLRGKVFDRYEANRWTRDAGAARQYALRQGWFEREPATPGAATVRQTIEVVADLDAVLVHAAGLSRLRFPGPTVRAYDDGVYELPRPLRAHTTYSVESRPDLLGGRYVLREQPADLQRYLQVPTDVSDQIRELAARITAAERDPAAKALLAEQYLRTHYQYSYETIARQGYTPLDWFLFEGKRGHCEFFASALAVMLRTQGIPTRLATGFSLGEVNPLTGYHEVRALDGHAWVEAYIEGRGWLMLEPTPFYPLPQPPDASQVASQTDRYLEQLAERARTLDADSLETQLITAARDAWMRARHLVKLIANIPRALGWYMALFLAGLALLAAGIYLGLLLIADARSNYAARRALARAARMDPPRAVLIVAGALEEVATARGWPRASAWTFREYIQHLLATEVAVPEGFSDWFDHSRYGEPMDHGDLARLAEVRQLVEGAMRAQRWPRVRRALRDWRTTLRGSSQYSH